MSNKFALLSILVLCSTLFSFIVFSPRQNGDRISISLSSGDDYNTAWHKVDSLQSKGLTRSALEVVEQIYNSAKKENNQPQIIKSFIHKLKFTNYTEEESHQKIITEVKNQIDSSSFPSNAIFRSILAQIYWQYYTYNRYRFQNRTETVNFDNDDFQTWDLPHLIKEIIKQYQLSLEKDDSLKFIPIEQFKEVIVYFNSKDAYLRPTLYDLLSHNALSFYMNDEASVTEPVYKFEFKEAAEFAPPEDFIKINFETRDSLSLKFFAAKLLQSLIGFHLKDEMKDALIDVDLMRLNFIRKESINQFKDSLYLNSLVQMEKTFADIPYSSMISFNKADYFYELGKKYSASVSDAYKWDLKNAKEICESAIEKYPDTHGASECLWLKNEILQKNLTINTEYGNLPEKPFRALVAYRNTNKIFLRIIPWNERKEKYAPKENVEKIKFYTAQKPLKEWEVQLPDDKDFQAHSIEIKIPSLEKGEYLILAGSDKNFSADKNFVAYGKTWVTNLSYLRREKSDESEIVVIERESGDPVAGADVIKYIHKYTPDYREYRYERVGSKKTAKEGSVIFSKDKNAYENYKIVILKGDDRFESGDYYSYYNYSNYEQEIKTFFFLDRAIYRPGQTVYFKGLMFKSAGKKDHQILTNYRTKIYFYDANHQKISDINLTTNEFGTFNGSFAIPFGKIGGQYYISDGRDAQYFRVEEYKRPKFEVKFEPVKGSYSLNDKVIIHGFAKTYSGVNLNDVDVKYRVVRRAEFPYFYYWWRGFYDWFYANNNEMEITNGTAKTDKEGKFNVEFDLIPDLSIPKESKPVFHYTIYADVVDVTGETHSAQANVSAGYVALISNINLPEIINKDSLEKYSVSTANLNGEFEPAKVLIAVQRLKSPDRIFRKRIWERPDKFLYSKEEFYDLFEHDIYKDENEYYNWEKAEKVFDTQFTTTDSSFISFNNLNNWETGKYLLTLQTKDKNGIPIELQKYFTLFETNSGRMPGKEPAWVYMNEKSYEPGQTAELYIGSAEENSKALFEIEQDGKSIRKEWISLNEELKKIEIPVKEGDRGNIFAHISITINNENHAFTKFIHVPWTNKQLNISLDTFRDKLLPGSKEEWKLTVKSSDGKPASAEFLASMYDASLDAFIPHYWNLNIYPSFYARLNWTTDNAFGVVPFYNYNYYWNTYVNREPFYYPFLNNFGFYFYGFGYSQSPAVYMQKSGNLVMSLAKEESDSRLSEASTVMADKIQTQPGVADKEKEQKDQFEEVPLRKNLNETAFFYPELKTNEKGEVIISFTVPEALTKWKFMGLAVTKDLKNGMITKETVTQKDLMIQPNPPRFLREGDEIYFTAKVSNLSDHSISGSAALQLFNAITMEPVDNLFENSGVIKSFTAEKGESEGLSWRLKVPYGKVEALLYRVIAKSGNFSDGEENSLPVLVNRMLVTETLPLPVKGMQTKSFILNKLVNNNSSTLQNYNLTLEFTANPAWYAIQALPYMMEYPYECSEQIFNRFYANSIAAHTANSNPKIKKVFDDWKNTDKAALLSNLEKNQELKYALLEETPWVLDAQNETERKKRVGLLFDLVKMSDELSRAEQKLRENQYSNGGWPWFPGLPENRFITQYIVVGFGHLERLGIKDIRSNSSTWEMLKKAILYTDIRMYEDYEWIKKHGVLSKKNISYIQAQYLYGRSYYLDIPVDDKYKEAFDYWKGQAQKYWLSNNKYMQGMIGLALYRLYDAKTAKDIVKSIIENAVFNDEMGMYFKEEWGWWWYQAPIETQALLIEAVDEITKDQESVDLLKIWLLKQKQVRDWKTTKATAEACYALLLRGTDWLAETKMPGIKIGSETLKLIDNPAIHIESGTGYFKTSWKGEEIKPDMGKVTVANNNKVVAWGSLYWQYFEQLDKITPHETPLKIKKQLFKQINSDTGEKIVPLDKGAKLVPGDIVKVRIEIRVDRDMEFVHLKDMRASGFEPINVLSTYKYQDGLWYYENTRDAATNFFMDWLAKGTYVFEYPLRVIHKGDFSNGITTMQCMYAPEFAAHSEGVRVKVE